MMATGRMHELAFKVLKTLILDSAPNFQKRVQTIIEKLVSTGLCTPIEAAVLKGNLEIR